MKEETGRLDRGDGVHLAWRRIAGRGPGVVFLGGFNSDMTGSKAEFLAAWCAARGQAFLRFDYSGHGISEGRFEDGTIGRWAEDAACVIAALTQGPQILIGSSMGGWIALLLATRRKVPVRGLIGIAPAPDFTEDLMWAEFPPAVREAIMRDGVWHRPSEYGAPYPITRALIEDGRKHQFEWGPKSLFSIPLNARHQYFNGSGLEPARFASVNNMVFTMGRFRDESLIRIRHAI
ncbi:MAG: alpha/beta hydrolase, partial [Acetobacteraceae bacterium]|nr:alpha/beta hydrolase [Acetobacteraceae bacterium]